MLQRQTLGKAPSAGIEDDASWADCDLASDGFARRPYSPSIAMLAIHDRRIEGKPRLENGRQTNRLIAMRSSLLVAVFAWGASALFGAGSALADNASPETARQGAAALVRGDTGQAITHYTTALADKSLANDRRAMILNDRAVAYARLGNTKQAFDDFNEAVQLFPEYAALYNNRGNLLLALGLQKEAIKDFDRALVLSPGYAAAYNNRAGARMKAGEHQSAIQDYTHAIRLLPSAAAALSGRGLASLELGRPHAAIRDFSRAVNSDASFAAGYRNRAEAKIAVGHYEEAIEDLSRAVAFDINNGEMYRMRGHAYLVTGNAEAAIKDLSRAIELKPNDAALHAERGLAHGRGGNNEEALADLGFAIEHDPRSAVAFAYRAYVYKEAKQADVGMKDIDRALKLAPDSPEVLWAKAELEEAMGQRDQAIADFRRALYLQPNMKLAADALERLDGDAVQAEEKPVPGLGRDGWEVVARGKRFFAVNSSYRRLSVPLEMFGEGSPRIVSWDMRESKLRNIGVLIFSAGSVKSGTAEEETQFAAILNVDTNSVIAIEPHRQGDKVSTWTWGEDKVTIASVDGVTDEFVLRGDKAASAAAGGKRRKYTDSSGSSGVSGTAGEEGWTDPWGVSRPRTRRSSSGNSGSRPPRHRPKTLFELLFN